VKPEQDHRDTQACIDIFLQDKRNQVITEKVMGKYTRELKRLREFCERTRVYTVQGITRELLTAYCATWLSIQHHTRQDPRARPVLPPLLFRGAVASPHARIAENQN
jgi:hypothetical protein